MDTPLSDEQPGHAKRRPPAFSEYAADMLATVRELDLADVGLLTLMRWAYWTNGTLPTDHRRLARQVGLDPRKIHPRLERVVAHGFAVDPENADRLICPELDRQFARLGELRQKQSEGGKAGRARQLGRTDPGLTQRGDPSAESRGDSGVVNRTEQNRTTPLRGKPLSVDSPQRPVEPSAADVLEYQRAFGERT
jgi:hypothetical protein